MVDLYSIHEVKDKLGHFKHQKWQKLHYDYTFRVIKDYFGGKPLQEIKRHDYQMFLNKFGSDKAKETVEKVNTHIRSCVQDAIEEQINQHDFKGKPY